MSIPYALFENHLTSDPDDYMARVISTGAADLPALIDDVIQQGSTVNRPDILATLDAYHTAIIRRILAGQRVITPTANYGVSIQGNFDGMSDSFDPARHVVNAATSPGALLRAQVKEQAQIVKQEARRAIPNPVEYLDFGSESKNSVVTPGGPAQVNGHRMKFDLTDPLQGVFFIRQSDGNATRVEMIMRNKPAELMLMVPAGLTAGDYTLVVRTVITNDGEVRSGQLLHVLTVA